MKTAVVTGAGGGIGRATSKTLTDRGYRVVAVDVNRDAVEKVAAEIGARAAVLEVTDHDAVTAFAADLALRYEHIDALVNNAGIWLYAPLAEVPYQDARRVLEVNVLGAWSLVQALAPFMSVGSSVVNLSSTAATIAPSGVGLYPASKGAIEALTRQLAVELGPRGIRVNAVAPGLIRTGATEHGFRDGTRQALGATLPAGRHGEPEDVANVIAFLLSEQSAYVTGQVIMVDGGLTLVGLPASAAASTAHHQP
jgi:NAD(P)-dependent dehydrogenase (short-subunit alcohol dehydrogenase family)